MSVSSLEHDVMLKWIQTPNVYTIDCLERDRRSLFNARRVKERVNFVDRPDTYSMAFPEDQRKAILPDRRLLALHAVCARVAHMSGAAEFIDKLHFDEEESQVLLADGSSAGLLDAMLSPYAHSFLDQADALGRYHVP